MSNVLIWDNDGTVTGAKDPNDSSNYAKVILPNVEPIMQQAAFNFIISGFKSPESEAQNFDPAKVADKFIGLMEKLPINAAAFSPTIGGVACYVVLKKVDGQVEIRKAHEDPRYKQFIGQFKKPGIGMFVVIKDIAQAEFGQTIDAHTAIMIGNTWHDEAAAKDFGIPFLEAKEIHQGTSFITTRLLTADDIPTMVEALQRAGWPKTTSLFANYLVEHPERTVWVAFYGVQFAGYITLKWHSAYRPFAKSSIPEIMDLNVLPTFRGRGIGTQLLNLAEQEAAKRSDVVGIGVGLYAGKDGGYGAAQKLYVKRGYIPDGQGVTYNYEPVEPGSAHKVDDNLVLGLTKRLR